MKVRSTQSREGVKGGLRPFSSAPCRVKGQRPLWGLGQRPNCFSDNQFKEKAQARCRQRSVPASNFALPQKRPPKLLSPTPALCRAKWARPNCMASSHSWSFPSAGDFAPAGASRGLCGRPRHPFAVHTHVSWSLSWQGISPLRRRPKGMKTDECLRSPFGNLRRRHFWG